MWRQTSYTLSGEGVYNGSEHHAPSVAKARDALERQTIIHRESERETQTEK